MHVVRFATLISGASSSFDRSDGRGSRDAAVRCADIESVGNGSRFFEGNFVVVVA